MSAAQVPSLPCCWSLLDDDDDGKMEDECSFLFFARFCRGAIPKNCGGKRGRKGLRGHDDVQRRVDPPEVFFTLLLQPVDKHNDDGSGTVDSISHLSAHPTLSSVENLQLLLGNSSGFASCFFPCRMAFNTFL